ncbi:MAG: serine hydrolase, partial [Bacteroidota bacterium]
VLLSVSRASAGILDDIRELNARYGGRLGVAAKNLATGETIAYNADERFPTASAIKLPIMAAYFDLVGKGKLDPEARITLTAQDKKPGSGVLQFMRDSASITLADAVTLMIDLSDNTATNLVLDRLGPTHETRLSAVNDFLAAHGMRNTKLLNRVFAWETKQKTPEAMRFGLGVATPADMVLLLEQLHPRTLVDSSGCDKMMAILKEQFYNSMIPRFLPAGECKFLSVAHKTGSVNEVRVDVGLVLSDRATFAIAIFVDKSPDHLWDADNSATLLGARVARAVWNHFTGMTGEGRGRVNTADVDWTQFPGGRWAIFRSPVAPFPHSARTNGYVGGDGTRYPWFPHYADSSIVVFVPEGFHETPEGANVIVHFHGHMNDNVQTLEQYAIPQAMIAKNVNALLILPQGPYRARDSFGGKMEDEGGFRRMVEDVLATMKHEEVVTTDRIARVIISAHSGGYRPAGFSLSRGPVLDRVTHVFLFDALYGQHESFRDWLLTGGGAINAAFTEHLAKQHAQFALSVVSAGKRWSMTPTPVDHEQVVQTFMPGWLEALPAAWKFSPSQKSD